MQQHAKGLLRSAFFRPRKDRLPLAVDLQSPVGEVLLDVGWNSERSFFVETSGAARPLQIPTLRGGCRPKAKTIPGLGLRQYLPVEVLREG